MLVHLKRRGLAYCVMVLFFSGAAVRSVLALPGPIGLEPAGFYTFPEGFKPFDAPVTSDAVASGVPEIAEWTRSNEPGDTFSLTGSHLSEFLGDEAGRDSYFHVFGQSDAGKVEDVVRIRRLDELMAALTLPVSLPTESVYLLWARNHSGFGRPVAINRAEAWWIGPSKVESGEGFSLFGRNLKMGDGKTHLYIEELNRWLESEAGNGYKADFALPSDIAPGTYTVWAHNEHGKAYGWSQALTLHVIAKELWNGAVVNVKDFGARGDGVSDDFTAIKDAMNACPSHGTLYFPAGTYLVGDRFWYVKSDIRFKGEGENVSIIKAHPDNALSSNYGYFHDNMKRVEFRDLGFESNAGYQGGLVVCRFSEDVRFVNCRFSQLGSSSTATPVDMAEARNISFTDCTFIINRNIYTGAAEGLFFDGCSFLGRHDVNKLIGIDGSKNVSVINCTAEPYDSSDPGNGAGWTKGRFVNGTGSAGAFRNVYIGDNTTRDLCPRYDPTLGKYSQTVDQNSGEQIMFEYLKTEYRGAVVRTPSERTVICSGLSRDLSKQIIAVVDGPGTGQSRYVTDVDTGSGLVTVSEPWAVRPTAESVVIIGRFGYRFAVVNNDLQGHPRTTDPHEVLYGSGPAYTNYTASCGVSFYGGFFESVVDGNQIADMREGVMNWSLSEHANDLGYNVLQPNYFNLFKNNVMTNCLTGISDLHVSFGGRIPQYQDRAIMGSVWRNNVATGLTGHIMGLSSNTDKATISFSVFDRNRLQCTLYGIGGLSNVYHPVYVENEFEATGTGIKFSGGSQSVLKDNSWTGFSSDYGGELPGEILELPRRTVFVNTQADEITVPVHNGGTDELNWNVSTSEDWIQVLAEDRSVEAEGTKDSLTLKIDKTKAPAAGSQGIVSVSVAGQVKKLTVIYKDASAPGQSEEPGNDILSLRVEGPDAVDEGTIATFRCMAEMEDGTSVETNASWSLSSTAAGIDSAGILSAGEVDQNETITITASVDELAVTKVVQVRDIPATLTALQVSGPSSIQEGASGQFSCLAVYDDGSSEAVSPVWSVSGYATIDGTGLFAAGDVAGNQNVTVSASYEGITASSDVTVLYIAPVVTSLVISGALTVDEGSSAWYSCDAVYSDGSRVSVTPDWSLNSGSASISSSGLLLAGNLAGDEEVLLQAGYDGVYSSYAVTLVRSESSPTPESLVIGAPDSMSERSSVNLSCTAVYADQSSEAVTPVWSVNSGAVSISSSGELTVGDLDAVETVLVTASYSGISASCSIEIQIINGQVVYPLNGFENCRVKAALWDAQASEWHDLGEQVGPKELVVENINPDQWYWLTIREFNEESQEWVAVHENWLSM